MIQTLLGRLFFCSSFCLFVSVTEIIFLHVTEAHFLITDLFICYRSLSSAYRGMSAGPKCFCRFRISGPGFRDPSEFWTCSTIGYKGSIRITQRRPSKLQRLSVSYTDLWGYRVCNRGLLIHSQITFCRLQRSSGDDRGLILS